MDEMNENMDEMAQAEDIGTNHANSEENSVDSHRAPALDRPLKRDEKTGRFIAGTGSRGDLGGRPKGAKDRVSKAMVDLATELVADRGRELFHEMADRDPAQALALVSKIISPEELRAVYAEDRAELKDKVQEVTIRMVSAPSPQTRLEAPVSRIAHEGVPTETIIEHAAREASEAPVGPTQEELDREAAEAERERRARLNEQIRAHGGLTGKPSRSAAPDTLDYPDDGVI